MKIIIFLVARLVEFLQCLLLNKNACTPRVKYGPHWSLNRRKKAEHIFPPIAGLRFVQHSLAQYISDGKIVNSTEWAARTFFFPQPQASESVHFSPFSTTVSSAHFFDSSFPVPLSADLPRIFHFFPRQMLQSISPLFLASFSDKGKKGRRWGLSVTTATGSVSFFFGL